MTVKLCSHQLADLEIAAVNRLREQCPEEQLAQFAIQIQQEEAPSAAMELLEEIARRVLPGDHRVLWQLAGEDLTFLSMPLPGRFWDELTGEQWYQVTLAEQLYCLLFHWVRQALLDYVAWLGQLPTPLSPQAHELLQVLRKAYITQGRHGSLWVQRIQVELGLPATWEGTQQTRAAIAELEKADLIARQTCEDEQYLLSALAQRVELVRRYHLQKSWARQDRDQEALHHASRYTAAERALDVLELRNGLLFALNRQSGLCELWQALPAGEEGREEMLLHEGQLYGWRDTADTVKDLERQISEALAADA